MNVKRFLYYLSKITLLDEIVGFLYWLLGIYGIYVLMEYTINDTIRILFLAIYIIALVIVYFTLIRKIKNYFVALKK